VDELILTKWRSIREPERGEVRAVAWTDVAVRVQQPSHSMSPDADPTERKKALPVWHAAVFRDGHRKRDALDVLHGLWLDFDSDPAAEGPKRGNLTLRYEDVARAFGDVRHLAYTTCRHRPEAPRFKVLLPLSRAATPKEHARLCTVALARTEASGLHGLDADPSWHEPERAAFVPCGHAHYEGHATPVEVPPLDVDAWLAEADRLDAEAAAASWDDVRPIQPTTCEDPFPVSALPPVVRHAVEACAQAFQVPTSLPASLALTVLAAAASGRYRVRARSDWHEHLVLWTCVVQRPGTRKSPVFNALMEPLRAYQIESRAKAAERREEVRRERARVKAARQAAKGDERARLELELDALADTPTPTLYVGGDATPEAVAMALDANGGRLLLADDEAVFFQHAAGLYREGGANIDALLKGWDGSEITVHRKGSPPVCIPRALLSVMLTVQPEAVRRTRGDATLAGRGFLARFLWSLPPDGVGYRDVDAPELDPRAMAEWNTRVQALLAAPVPHQPDTLTLAPGAWERFQAYRRERERLKREGEALAATDALREWASKADGAVLRVAGVLHVASAAGTEISDATIADAIAIVDHYTAHARCALATFAADVPTQLANRVVSWLQREPARVAFSAREVHNKLADGLKAADVIAAMGVLEERGYVRAVVEEERVGPGRPRSASYEVNPRWYRG
jgi:replicative DNA helicase